MQPSFISSEWYVSLLQNEASVSTKAARQDSAVVVPVSNIMADSATLTWQTHLMSRRFQKVNSGGFVSVKRWHKSRISLDAEVKMVKGSSVVNTMKTISYMHVLWKCRLKLAASPVVGPRMFLLGPEPYDTFR